MFIEAKDGGSGGDNWSYKSCKAPVKSSPPINQHPVFLQAGCPSCHPTNNVKALKGKISHSMDLLTPSSPGVSWEYMLVKQKPKVVLVLVNIIVTGFTLHCFSKSMRCRGVYITDSISVDLYIHSSCAIGNNELVVTRN